MTARWGKAGVRRDSTEAARARARIRARAATDQVAHLADLEAAYSRWRDGLVRPFRITWALDLNGLVGPEVDVACLAREPEVDLWEEGERYPTWWQLRALAELTGMTAHWFTLDDDPLPAGAVFLCGLSAKARRTLAEAKPPVLRYPARVLDARPPSPQQMPPDTDRPTPLQVELAAPGEDGDQLHMF